MPIEHQLSKDNPIMIAWENYKNTPEYENTKHWATNQKHTEGSLWAAFLAGFMTQNTDFILSFKGTVEVQGDQITIIEPRPERMISDGVYNATIKIGMK